MMVIPNFAQNRISIIQSPLTSRRSVVFGSRAANIRQLTKAICQCRLQVREGDGCSVRGSDRRRGKPTVCGEDLVVRYRGLEEIDYLAVILVRGTVARYIEGRIACSMFRELVAPEITIRTALRDPIPIKRRQQRSIGWDQPYTLRRSKELQPLTCSYTQVDPIFQKAPRMLRCLAPYMVAPAFHHSSPSSCWETERDHIGDLSRSIVYMTRCKNQARDREVSTY